MIHQSNFRRNSHFDFLAFSVRRGSKYVESTVVVKNEKNVPNVESLGLSLTSCLRHVSVSRGDLEVTLAGRQIAAGQREGGWEV